MPNNGNGNLNPVDIAAFVLSHIRNNGVLVKIASELGIGRGTAARRANNPNVKAAIESERARHGNALTDALREESAKRKQTALQIVDRREAELILAKWARGEDAEASIRALRTLIGMNGWHKEAGAAPDRSAALGNFSRLPPSEQLRLINEHGVNAPRAIEEDCIEAEVSPTGG